MSQPLDRRSFIRKSALAAGALSAAGYFTGCSTSSSAKNHAADPSEASGKSGRKLNVALIGCGSRAMQHLDAVVGTNKQNLVAIVDPDERRWAEVQNWYQKKGIANPNPKPFTDYRKLFDKMGKQIDAVFIAAPNHHHAPASLFALEHGISPYCEKPLCHDIGEARAMRAMAAKYPKLATQMGAQGHCMDGYRRLCEYIWSGAIGQVRETHSWTNRANGGVGPRPPHEKVPSGLHWDNWIGPAPYRPFHADLIPHEWHGWYDFGNGSLGNMGCHTLDGVYWALKVSHPTSIEAEYVRGGTDERLPVGTRIRWDIPAREDMPALKAYWYDGLNDSVDAKSEGLMRQTSGASRNLPPMLLDLMKQYPDEDFASSGTIYIGEKGTLYTADYGDKFRMVPIEKMADFPKPPRTLPRPKDVFTDFIQAVQAGKSETAAPFEYGSRLTEFVLLGNMAQHAGAHNIVQWDGPNMKVTNRPELNKFLKRTPRHGWRA